MEKLELYYRIFNFWFHLKQDGIEIADYLRDNKYRNVAIYGTKELGERLYGELRGTDINVVCVIDKNPYILGDFHLISPDGNIPKVDLIIVTADYYFVEIENHLKQKTDADIFSMSMLLSQTDLLISVCL